MEYEKHGQASGGSVSKEYEAWRNMKARCTRKTASRYKNYGGRGIAVCPTWMNSFEQFYNDVGPAPSPNHSLGRIDNDLWYCPANVRWETVEQQSGNKSTLRLFCYCGQTLSLRRWCTKLGLKYKTIHKRISSGYSFDEAISLPNRTWPGKVKLK